MNWKAIRSFVILLSVSLLVPPPITALNSLSRHKPAAAQMSSSDKTGMRGHHNWNSAAAGGGGGPDFSLRYDNSEERHSPHQGPPRSEKKEPALIRLKRIKREVALASPKTLNVYGKNMKSGVPHVEMFTRNPEKMTHQTGLADDKTLIGSGTYHEFRGPRLHKDMLRRFEDGKRRLGNGRTAEVHSTKTNGLPEHIQNAGHYRSGNYLHHKHEQDRLENAAKAAAAQRQRARKKNKNQRNKSEMKMKGATNRDFEKLSRPHKFGQSMEQIPESQAVQFRGASNRGHGRVHAQVKSQAVAEAKKRTRRGQGSKTGAAKTGNRVQDVRMELERIRRMQRDLVKEINHLEHTKKKKQQHRGKITAE